ncbi:uncharacterized protein LOC129151743 [Eptesicus fuscus]|uniref:uncharacterized protein LOC129151743 n=1 Tax=Eptesicus fuscus TaxID=29078 RepID=UPI002403CD87|nr:uncharacterized protein LOC129151743 [Eptesicus fuscus]
MFSCCLPVSRGRDLESGGSEEGGFRRGRRWGQTQPRRRLWPFSRRDSQSSTRVIEEQSAAEEDICPVSSRAGADSHPPEGQGRPEVSVATPGPAEPGPWDVPRRTPLPKQTRLPRELRISEHRSHVTRPRSNNLEPKEAEPKGEKMVERAPAQEAGPASASAPVTPTEESNAGAALQECPPPVVLPLPAAPPAAAVEPGPPCEAPPDITEAPPPLPEEPSLQPVPVPATEEELPPENTAGPALEPLVELALALPPEFILPPLFDYFLLFSLIVIFSYSPRHDSF